jgi:4'-phosphopantetheinyl transferase
MPIINIKHINDHITCGIWEIVEDVAPLRREVCLSDTESIEYEKIQNIKRRKEWLSARHALMAICRKLKLDYKGTDKDDHKKPHLVGLSGYISLSHSFPYATALLNTQDPCGIDIEQAKAAFTHVSSRFLNEEEQNRISGDPLYLCSAWAAKEVLFKLHGKRSLSFRNNLSLSPYSLQHEGQIDGHIKLDTGIKNYLLQYFQLDGYIVCYST